VQSRPFRIVLALAILAVLTLAAHAFPVNSTTLGFAYLLLVLAAASTWGFIEASVLSIAATLAFNYFFLPPVGNFTIADPQNWVALITFLTTALITSRLSTKARNRALDAIERQQDIERLYSFSRAILLINSSDSFPGQLIFKAAEIFQLEFVILYDRRTEAFHRAGPSDADGFEDQLREVARIGTDRSIEGGGTIAAIRLGSEPIGSLAIQGLRVSDSVSRGIVNLVAIGLERARAQDLASEIEATRRSERLRTSLIDALAHEFKTPLTSIRATTTLLLDSPDQSRESRIELLRIADEESQRLGNLIDDTVSMARVDAGHIQVNPQILDIFEIIEEIRQALQPEFQTRPLEITREIETAAGAFDRHLVKLAMKQLIDNALKYSPPGSPLKIRVRRNGDLLELDVTNAGRGIPAQEQSRIFERLYRSPSVQDRIPGSGLGLSIAQSIARAHGGDLSVSSFPGETTFKLVLPLELKERRAM
jgi:two-component system, OmpR family, sensor histidine kinase KdpD